jgi:predicted short-subunit dehydrogenase-like oxidoreductase (DUF2520 family)
MRELERDLPATSDAAFARVVPERLAVVGAGRAGGAIARAATAAGIEAQLLGRNDALVVSDPDATAVLLCVPDAEITAACERVAEVVPAGTWVGHVSGATPLAALEPAAAAGCRTFSLHPLQTIPSADADLSGAPCAIAAADDRGVALARALGRALGMSPFEVPEEGRAAYHAAASIASNFLIALEESAADALAAAGVLNPREVLAPLVLRTAANWSDSGADALTGPIARGDEETVARHLAALRDRAPELAPLYEALTERTRAIARAREDGS